MSGPPNPPAVARWIVARSVPDEMRDGATGDLEEIFRRDCAARGTRSARFAYWRNACAFAWQFAIEDWREQRRGDVMRVRMSTMDVTLGLRMLRKYPGLSIAGGLALAIAIGVGAAWYELAGNLLRPSLPLPGGDRIVEVEMRDAAASQDERRILHDLAEWRRDAKSLQDLGAYRTLERNLVLGDAHPEPLTVAETTAAAFRVANVRPLLGRPLIDADERPGAPPVVVAGYTVWQRYLGGRDDALGRVIQVGRTRAMVVGVMPEGFAFPVNHRLWMPLQPRPAGYGPLEGPPVRVVGRLAPDVTQAQANAELAAIVARKAAASPATHAHLRPRVLAYGGESPGDRSAFEVLFTHLPIVLVLVVACANVGTLVYARTAARDGEIAMRHALGATRGRIVGQLFVEALVLAAAAAAVGLAGANAAIEWGMPAYYGGAPGGLPFWVDPGLKPRTIVYAASLTVLGAAILGALPAWKVTGGTVHARLRTLGGGSTLRFGRVWTAVMIAQVALTVICIPPAIGISSEALRDRRIREQFPAEQYLAVRIDLDRAREADGEEPDAAFAARFDRTYAELEQRIRQEPDVRDVTFADRLPGMGPAVRRGEFEAAPGIAPTAIADLWTAAVGPRFFDAFDRRVSAGRGFHAADRAEGARTVLVNEAFARRYASGANPVGRRVRFGGADQAAEPWLEIVGVVADIGMTPTDLGEAPYVFRPASPATAQPLVMAVRVAGDPAALAPRVRAIAAGLDPVGLRVDEVRPLDDLAWKVDVPMMVAAGAIAAVVGLGLFLSAAGIFALVSLSVARRTREIGLRAALGASNIRLLAGVFGRAAVLVGSGIAAGNLVLMLFVVLQPELALSDVADALLLTSAVMLTVGLLACVEPARRALRIDPIDALKEA